MQNEFCPSLIVILARIELRKCFSEGIHDTIEAK